MEKKSIPGLFPPRDTARVNVKEGSFGEYLRNLPLRSHGTKVHYFDGREKWNRSVYCAVVDMEIGKRIATMSMP